jgi:septum formation protein
VAERHPGEVVLAADTLVVLHGSLLGKPADALEAVAMLTALRDRVHIVYTAVCVMNGHAVETRVSATDVKMRAYTDSEIEAYVETGDPLDKAGAYGIQDPRFAPVETWEGCYSAVMGLPMALAAEMLGRAGVATANDVAAACEAITGDRCCHRNGGLREGRREPCTEHRQVE